MKLKMLASWKKSYDKPRQRMKKQRHHFADKGPYSQSYGFSSSHVRMSELDHGEELMLSNWCWRRLLRVRWTARRSNQSILKEINPEYSLEGRMLKLQYFGHLIWTTDSLEKTLMLEKIEGKRRTGWQRMRWLDGINYFNGHEFEQTLGYGEGLVSLVCCSSWDHKESDRTEQQFHHSFSSVQFSLLSRVRLFATPMNRSTPGLLLHHQLSEFTQTHVHWVGHHSLLLFNSLEILFIQKSVHFSTSIIITSPPRKIKFYLPCLMRKVMSS